VPAQVIVSLSGIRSAHLDLAAELSEVLAARGVPLSLLVAPRSGGGHRLTRDAPTLQWLRGRRDAGDAIVLHGYDQAATKGRRAALAALPEHEAALRLAAADRVLESLGLRTRLFVPPRWAVSAGALRALPRTGFRLCADLTAVHDLEHASSVRARVLGVTGRAGGSGLGATENAATEPWWCRALVLGAGRTARRGGVVRIAVDARHLGRSGPRQAVLDAVDLALHHGARPDRYRLASEPAVVRAA
jgi:predicted deacetylase